ncbi:hypothetical protein JCM13580A_20830 [Streptomyces drozdowiczii]
MPKPLIIPGSRPHGAADGYPAPDRPGGQIGLNGRKYVTEKLPIGASGIIRPPPAARRINSALCPAC